LWGASLAQGYPHFYSRCDFMMGFGKPRLCTKFEVASFSDCVNIEGEPQILGSSLSPVLCLPFLLRVMWQTPYCVLNLKPLQKYYTRTPQFWGAPLAQGDSHFLLCVWLMMGLGNLKLCTTFEIASFSRCRNITGKPPISESSPSPGPYPFFLLVGFYYGPWQTAAACQIWSRWLHLLRKYKGICF